MRISITILFCLLISNLYSQKAKKAIFVIADGIPADVIERLHPPAISTISKVGGYARAHVGGEKDGYSQTPTISAVGYNSLLTGTWVNKHNVWDNDIKEPNYNYWNIFKFLKTQYPKKKTAIFSTWLDNRTRLARSDVIDYYFDGMELDTVKFPHDTNGYFYHIIDEAVADTTAAYIRKKAPDLSWVYLEYTDEMGHRHGNGKQMDDAVMKMDKQIQKIWAAIQYRQKSFNEDWVIYITTDHGREENGYHHGYQSDRERTTWIVTNAKDLNERFRMQQAAIVDIMPSIANFMGIKIPADKLREIDGVPLTGKLSATDAEATLNKNKIEITWKPVSAEGKTNIWISTTDNFKNGGKDNYKMVKSTTVAAGKAEIVSPPSNGIYKIVIEMPYNYLNRWIIGK